MIDLEMVSAAISLFGMALVARHESRILGFFVCGVGNVAWLYVGLNPFHLSTLVLFGGYLICNTVGFHDELIEWIRMRRAKQTMGQLLKQTKATNKARLINLLDKNKKEKE